MVLAIGEDAEAMSLGGACLQSRSAVARSWTRAAQALPHLCAATSLVWLEDTRWREDKGDRLVWWLLVIYSFGWLDWALFLEIG